MSSELAGTPTRADEPYAVVIPMDTRHGAEQILRMPHDASGDFRAVVEERAGTPTHCRLDRDKARQAFGVGRTWHVTDPDFNRLLDALEACVVPDPRLARIEALVAAYDDAGLGHTTFEHELRAILRGDQ